MEYLTSTEMSEKWGITSRRISVLCAEGRIEGVIKKGKTYLDYPTNIDISDDPPSEYVGRYKEKLGEEGYKTACEQNTLPENFETLEYNDFLAKRRVLMSETVKKAFKELCK